MMKYDIKEFEDGIKNIERLSGSALPNRGNRSIDDLYKLLYDINQQSHEIVHNITTYGLHTR